jgi:leucyl aminopeptidase
MDLTEEMLAGSSSSFAPVELFALPTGPTQQAFLNPLIAQVSIPSMTTFLTNFSSFPTRYYKNPSGTQSAEWLYTQINNIALKSSSKITISKFANSGYGQFSVIARFEGTAAAGAPVVILGSHQDSINQNNPSTGAAPGADDDGTGSAALYEAFRILAGSGYVPTNPVEFQ